VRFSSLRPGRELEAIEGAGLVVVGEGSLELRDAVGQFVPDDLQRFGESFEDDAVAIAIHHLRAVPKGVVVVEGIVDGGIEPHAIAIDGISFEDLVEKVVGRAGKVVSLVDVTIFAPGVAFAANPLAGQSGAMGEIVDGPAPGSSGCGQSHGAQVSKHVTMAAQTFGMLERLQRALAQLLRAVPGQVAQHVGRDDGADRAADMPPMVKNMNIFPHRISWIILSLPRYSAA
jgi:hypothetical protein